MVSREPFVFHKPEPICLRTKKRLIQTLFVVERPQQWDIFASLEWRFLLKAIYQRLSFALLNEPFCGAAI